MQKHDLVINVGGKRVVIGHMLYLPHQDIREPRDAVITIPVFVDAKIDDIPVDLAGLMVTIKMKENSGTTE